MARTYFLVIEGAGGTGLSLPGTLLGKALPTGVAFEVDAFSWGVTNPVVAAAGGGRAAGKPTFQELTVVTRTSAASPNLLVQVASGTVSPQVLLIILDARSQGPREVERYELQASHFTGLRNSGTQGGNGDTQELTILYEAIRHTVFPVDYQGKDLTPVTGGWNLVRNAPL